MRCGPLIGNTQGTNGSARKSARHVQFKEKEKYADYWNENFLFREVFTLDPNNVKRCRFTFKEKKHLKTSDNIA